MSALAAREGAGALDLHEGISPGPGERHPDPAANGCPRWPETLRLLSSQGELVRGRCKATNQCAYCARLSAVETAEMLALDALHGSAPTTWAVLTTREPSMDPSKFYKSRELVLRDLKSAWPALQAATITEFTTGYGRRAAGQRRPHFNVMLKGVPTTDVDQARDVITSRWCSREDAEPWAQHVGTIAESGGLMRYLALHFQKESQQPPPGWRGHRFSASRGYLWTSTPAAREAARRSLREKRELWRAIGRGLDPLAAEAAVAASMAQADATSWRLLHLNPTRPLEGRCDSPLPAATA